MLPVEDVESAAGLFALRFNEPPPDDPCRPTGDAKEIVVCDGNEAAILAAATGVKVTLSRLANESEDALLLELFISCSC